MSRAAVPCLRGCERLQAVVRGPPAGGPPRAPPAETARVALQCECGQPAARRPVATPANEQASENSPRALERDLPRWRKWLFCVRVSVGAPVACTG